ncbi:hypothetical protein ACIBK9_03745 [Nonomuraea sp. NPDC050227]|uniref:hypothetical protein n=1 Tax=Nonomuraea sp. NPDC050227 TaxID=3364360 RepID=UPI0037A2AA07
MADVPLVARDPGDRPVRLERLRRGRGAGAGEGRAGDLGARAALVPGPPFSTAPASRWRTPSTREPSDW